MVCSRGPLGGATQARTATGRQNARACLVASARAREEAITNIKEAIQGYIAALKDDGLPVPEERFETLLVAV